MPRGVYPRKKRGDAGVSAGAVPVDEAGMQASIARMLERSQGQVGYAALPDVPAGAEPTKPPLVFPAERQNGAPSHALPDLQARIAVSQALGYASTFQAQLDALAAALPVGDPRVAVESAAGLVGNTYNRLAAAAGLLAPRVR